MMHFNFSGGLNNLRDRNRMFSTEKFGSNDARNWKRRKDKTMFTGSWRLLAKYVVQRCSKTFTVGIKSPEGDIAVY